MGIEQSSNVGCCPLIHRPLEWVLTKGCVRFLNPGLDYCNSLRLAFKVSREITNAVRRENSQGEMPGWEGLAVICGDCICNRGITWQRNDFYIVPHAFDT